MREAQNKPVTAPPKAKTLEDTSEREKVAKDADLQAISPQNNTMIVKPGGGEIKPAKTADEAVADAMTPDPVNQAEAEEAGKPKKDEPKAEPQDLPEGMPPSELYLMDITASIQSANAVHFKGGFRNGIVWAKENILQLLADKSIKSRADLRAKIEAL